MQNDIKISENVVQYAAKKDPKIIKLGDYENVSDKKYEEKIKSDNLKYAKNRSAIDVAIYLLERYFLRLCGL